MRTVITGDCFRVLGRQAAGSVDLLLTDPPYGNTDLSWDGPIALAAFAGSGTTGVACAQTGRRFLGVEQDRAYARIARRRLRSALSAAA